VDAKNVVGADAASFVAAPLSLTLGVKIAMRLAGIILLTLAITACSGKPYVVKPALESSDVIRSYPLFVVSHGWHTGLIIPASFLNQTIPDLKDRFGDAAYYEIGWGDKGFYQAQEITTGLTLQAMFWSEGAIMHIVAVPDSPSKYFGQSEVVSTCLTYEQTSSLSTFVSNSFAHDPQRHIVRLKQGIYGNSQFYDGEGRYYLLNTCNKWTAKGLQSAGVDISPSLSLTSESVMSAIRALRHQCTLIPNPAVERTLRDKAAVPLTLTVRSTKIGL
jgi:uncharacterized protein (TIGR02117 family)